MKKNYRLTKLSSIGFQYETSSLEDVHNLLSQYICRSCLTDKTSLKKDIVKQAEGDYLKALKLLRDYEVELEFAFISDEEYNNLTTEEKIDELLSTACGCEFMLEKFNSYNELMKAKMEDVQHYFKEKGNEDKN